MTTNFDEYSTKEMLKKPITELARLIGEKWYLTIEQLAERSGVGVGSIKLALRGENIHPYQAKKLKKFLMNYKGEMVCEKNLPVME